MFRRNFIYFTCCFALLQTAGCGKQDTQTTEINSTSNQPSNISAKTGPSGVDGYKSLKFGMNSSQILKLPECAIEYQKKVEEDKESLAAYEVELVQLKKRYDALEELKKNNEQKYDFDKFVEMADAAKSEIAQAEKSILYYTKQGEPFSQESADNWFADGKACQIQLFNENTDLYPQFENSKLVGVAIKLGGFNNDKFQAIAKSLSEKYSVSHTYTDEQVESFNQLQSPKISVTFASGQVSLIAVNTSKVNFIGGFNFDNFGNAYTTTDRVMVLGYFDLAHAALAEKESAKGEVTENDL